MGEPAKNVDKVFILDLCYTSAVFYSLDEITFMGSPAMVSHIPWISVSALTECYPISSRVVLLKIE